MIFNTETQRARRKRPMGSLHENMNEYRTQLEKGAIQQAYKGLMEYIASLKSYLMNKYPEYPASGGIYPGYMDMTYFPLFPEALRKRKLKIAVVFLHEAFRFEIWLAGVNKQVQGEYWKLFNESGWAHYRLVPPAKGVDSILEHILVDEPDFDDLDDFNPSDRSRDAEIYPRYREFPGTA